MNNKGFGIPHVLAFAVFVFVVVYVFYSFTLSIGNAFSNSGVKNYKNVYRKYLNSSALVVPNNQVSNSESQDGMSYVDMELKIADATKTFMSRKHLRLNKDENYYVSLPKLQSEELVPALTDPVYKAVYCKGYGKVVNAEDSTIYKGYVMCGNSYKTIGFDEKYAE